MRLNFAETLREERTSLPNPIGYGFDREVWHQAYLAQRDGSPVDHNVYLLGLILAEQTERVLASIDELASHLHFRKIDELTSFFSRRINRIQLSVFHSFENALEGIDAISSERLREMRCFTDAAGNSHALQVPMEAVVDAICSALKLLGRKGGIGRLRAEEQESDALEDALNGLMDLAQHSLSIQRVWNSVVWWQSAVAVAQDCRSYAVDEGSSDLAMRSTVDLARRPALMARSIKEFMDGDPVSFSNSVLVPYVRLRDGYLTVESVPAFVVPDDERKILLDTRRSHGILQDATLSGFIEQIHPQVGLSIMEIMLIWGELAAIAGQLHKLALPLDIVKDKIDLSTIVESRFPRNEIIKAVKECVVLSTDKVKECIDFLCFTPSKALTLWDKPLLSAGDDVVLLWWPLQGVHHARVLSAWAKNNAKLKPTFDRKGAANENILAEAMRGAIAKSVHRHRMRFIGSSLHPRHKPDEEIDILIVIDDTAFVIEVASIPSPAEAYEFYETEKRLDQKAGQCRAQCAALKQDLDQIAEWANDDGYRGRVTKVFSLVIANSYLRDGVYSDDVCYCHWDTLINIIADSMYFGMTRGVEEFTLKAPIQVDPQGCVADGVIAALRRSPKAEFFARCVVPVEYRIKGFDDTDVEGYYQAMEMDIPPQEMLEKRLRECSFSATLEETNASGLD